MVRVTDRQLAGFIDADIAALEAKAARAKTAKAKADAKARVDMLKALKRRVNVAREADNSRRRTQAAMRRPMARR